VPISALPWATVARRLSFKAQRERSRDGRRECEGGGAPVLLSPCLTRATVETVVREKYYYPGKSGGVPPRCQIGHVRMETRRKFLHLPLLFPPNPVDRGATRVGARKRDVRWTTTTATTTSAGDSALPLCINRATGWERGEGRCVRRSSDAEMRDGGVIRPGRRSDVDGGGLSPRASSRKGRRWNGRVDGRGGTIDNVIFETLIISAWR